jgi:hypothetical protein
MFLDAKQKQKNKQKNLKGKRAIFSFTAKKCFASKRNKKSDAERRENMGQYFRLSARIGSETDPISLLSENNFYAKTAHTIADLACQSCTTLH